MKVERHIHLKDELICEFTEELTENLVYKSELIRVVETKVVSGYRYVN